MHYRFFSFLAWGLTTGPKFTKGLAGDLVPSEVYQLQYFIVLRQTSRRYPCGKYLRTSTETHRKTLKDCIPTVAARGCLPPGANVCGAVRVNQISSASRVFLGFRTWGVNHPLEVLSCLLSFHSSSPSHPPSRHHCIPSMLIGMWG